MRQFLIALAVFSIAWILPRSVLAQEGFGRFGRINDDGLLTLNVTPNGFETIGDAKLRVSWRSETETAGVSVSHIDPTEKRLVVSDTLSGSLRIDFSVLYPGLSLTNGKTYRFRFSDERRGDVALLVERVGLLKDGSTAYLVRRGDKPAPPLLLILPRGRAGVQAPRDEIAVDPADPRAEVRWITPWGIRPVAASVPLSRLRPEVSRWADLPMPHRLSHRESLSRDGKRATVTETFTGGIAPLPPVLSFAMSRGYPVATPWKPVATRAITKWGAYAFVRGGALRYTLPVPPTDERGYVRDPKANPDETALLNDLVGHLGGAWAENGVDLAYAGMTNAQMAWAFLTPAKRLEVAASWRRYLPEAFALPPYGKSAAKKPWKIATEPFTHQSYPWTYKIDGPGGYDYDLDWGNALPLYGLYKYAAYTGDWAFVRRHWGDVQRIYRYFDLGDDWAWMTVVNADHGYSTGTGDPLCAAYAATIACLKMARALGDSDAERHFAVRAARVAVPTVSRFWYTSFARAYDILGPKDIALGFQELEGYTNSDLGGNPWYPTTLLSGDGALPELFSLYAAFGGDALRVYEDDYARAYPDWFDGSVKYPFHTTYAGNGIYVTFPHIYARSAVLGQPTSDLLRFVAAARGNRNNGWIGPNVVAEVLARGDGSPVGSADRNVPAVVLTDWGDAAYRDGVWEGKTIHLTFALPSSHAWRIGARFAPDIIPARVLIDGKPQAFRFSKGCLVCHADHAPSGDFEATIVTVSSSGTTRSE